MDDLTRTQREVYETLDYFIKKNGYSPSFRELGEITNRSSSASVFYELNILKKKGYIDYIPKKSRTIRIIK